MSEETTAAVEAIVREYKLRDTDNRSASRTSNAYRICFDLDHN
jgi:hypothetical protein